MTTTDTIITDTGEEATLKLKGFGETDRRLIVSALKSMVEQMARLSKNAAAVSGGDVLESVGSSL